jgi:hypothetical protein
MYGEKTLTGYVSASVSDDVGVSFVADIEIGAELERDGNLRGAMANTS